MDPISTLSGLVDAAAFVDGSTTASATKVTAELAQLLNKTNEIIGGLTVVAGDLDTEEAARATLAGRVTTAETDITAAENNILDHGDRIVVLEASAASYGITRYLTTAEDITTALILGTRTIVAATNGVSNSMSLYLPCVGNADDLQTVGPIKFINDGLGSRVKLKLLDGLGKWGNGSGGSVWLALEDTEWCDLMPVASRVDQGDIEWFVVGGKTYADLGTL